MSEDVELDYEYLAQRALRRVVRDALEVTAELGKVPGKHHFFIEFGTGADGVDIPPELRAQFPERMTIVLQHQFENLRVHEEGFSVTLWFKGKPARLVVPFAAVTSFADPGAEFGLRFDDLEGAQSETADKPSTPVDKEAPAGEAPDTGGEIVSLDKFRRK